MDRRKAVTRIGLISAWSAPLINTVTLPAHAQTSDVVAPPPPPPPPPPADQCATGLGAPAGCYAINGTFPRSFSWPGGSGPISSLDLFDGLSCAGNAQVQIFNLVAVCDRAEAEQLLGSTAVNQINNISPAPSNGALFFELPPV